MIQEFKVAGMKITCSLLWLITMSGDLFLTNGFIDSLVVNIWHVMFVLVLGRMELIIL